MGSGIGACADALARKPAAEFFLGRGSETGASAVHGRDASTGAGAAEKTASPAQSLTPWAGCGRRLVGPAARPAAGSGTAGVCVGQDAGDQPAFDPQS
jgi:hypothetical protein